jgi:prepilin-type N-terminal cleavage/methylation domain-containing protein
MKQAMNRQRGFSLIELAIVVVVISLLLGGLLVPLSAQKENERRSENEVLLQQAREALLGFVVVNVRLPCPDTSGDGIEDACSALTTVANAGRLPWVTLGLNAETDPWGSNHFVFYRVNGAFIMPAGPPAPFLTLNTAGTGAGMIDIYDTSPCAAPSNPVALNVPALVWTDAKEFYNGNTDEDENNDGDTCYVSRGYNSVAGSEFDDQMVWLSSSILFNRLVSAGILP